jgi:hypothetical protein
MSRWRGQGSSCFRRAGWRFAVAAMAVAASSGITDPSHAGTTGSATIEPTDTQRRAGPCTRLRGRDLAPARKVKLVRRRNRDDGTDLLGCVRPRGRVRVLASSSDQETTVVGYKVRQVAGAIVLLDSSYDSQYASDRSVSVSDIRTGREYRIARSCLRIDGSPCGGPRATAAAAFVNRRGQAAAAIVLAGTDTTTIAGFSSRGKRRDLDSGPSGELPGSALELMGSTVSWTHSGGRRTATLSG